MSRRPLGLEILLSGRPARPASPGPAERVVDGAAADPAVVRLAPESVEAVARRVSELLAAPPGPSVRRRLTRSPWHRNVAR